MDARVVLGNLLRPSVVGTEAFPNRGGGQAPDGELLSALEEGAAVDSAVNVTVEKVKQFLGEIAGFLALHDGRLPTSGKHITLPVSS